MLGTKRLGWIDMRKLALGTGICVFAACAQAQLQIPNPPSHNTFAVGLHLTSVHDIAAYENNNVGAYVKYRNWSVGAFRNSVRKQSVYAAYTYELMTPRMPVVDSVALTLGLTSGYPKKIEGTDVSVLFVPTMGVKLRPDFWLRVAVIPAFEQFNRSTAVHFMVEKEF